MFYILVERLWNKVIWYKLLYKFKILDAYPCENWNSYIVKHFVKAWLQYGHIHKTWSWRFYCSTSPVLLICNCVALNKAIQQQLPFYGGLQYLQFEVTRIVPFTSIEIVLYTPFFVLNILLPTENIVHCSYQYIHIRNIWYHIFYLNNQMQLSPFATLVIIAPLMF